MAAAQAGYSVAAFDIFNDIETRQCCFYSTHVAFTDGGFDAEDLWSKLSAANLTDAVVTYGSGLENHPALLDKISRHFPIHGNTAETVASLKDPRRFFPLLDRLGIACPETVFEMPSPAAGWLVKKIGGSGGTHIRYFEGSGDGYYQREVAGRAVSVLFLADGRNIEVVGFNEQWVTPLHGKPFCYGGAVGSANFPESTRRAMAEAAAKVTHASGLRGLNSMDFMLSDNNPLALEVNPRLSASFDLYDIPDLFQRHISACGGDMAPILNRPEASKAHVIYYAKRSFRVTEEISWPIWVTDRPPSGTTFEPGQPLCTVHAQGGDPVVARELVFARVQQLDAQLQVFEN